VALFPPVDPKEPWRVLPWFWVPGMNATDLGKRDGVPYAAWERDGLVELTSGNEIDAQTIRAKVNAIAKQFSLAEVGFDEWNATEIARQLREEDGIALTAVRQGSRSLSGPMKELEAMTAGRRIEHGGNPVLRWMLGNVAVKRDENDNVQPNKRKSTGRIDGVVALVSGLARALAIGEGVNETSVYETEGLMVL
jgi:phage terminase large subunit-like protein